MVVFTGRSKAVLLLWIIFVVCVSCCRPFLSVRCSLVVACWGGGGGVAGWPLGFLDCVFSCIFVAFPMWCPGSAEVLDYIDS